MRNLSRMKRFYSIITTSLILLAGCRDTSPEPTALIPVPTAASVQATSTPSYQNIEPLSETEATPPILIEVSSVGLLHSITPMEWEVTDVNGQRTTVWKVPDDAAGWHIDSARAGMGGNVILSGHQEQGAAVFRSIALGSVQVGQEIYLTGESGQVFVYKVTEVSEPIPLDGTTAEQFALMERYYTAGEKPLLTLITGWPDFTTTHRLFVVAELVGQRS